MDDILRRSEDHLDDEAALRSTAAGRRSVRAGGRDAAGIALRASPGCTRQPRRRLLLTIHRGAKSDRCRADSAAENRSSARRRDAAASIEPQARRVDAVGACGRRGFALSAQSGCQDACAAGREDPPCDKQRQTVEELVKETRADAKSGRQDLPQVVERYVERRSSADRR